jgi:flagellar motor switch protein FliM
VRSKKSGRFRVCLPGIASKKQENTVEQQIHGKNKNNDNQSLSLFNKALSTELVTRRRTKNVYT